MVIERKIEAAAKELAEKDELEKPDYLLQGARLEETEGYLEDYGCLGMLDGLAAISRDGQTIVTGSSDGTARLWDISGKLLHTLKGHEKAVNSVAISGDGQTIVTGSWDQTVRFWDASGNLVHILKGMVNTVAISDNGQTIITGSDDGTVRLWDASGKLRHILTGHESWVTDVAVSEDGQTIVSGSYDNKVRLWREGSWKDWLAVGCDRLQFHPVLRSQPLLEKTTVAEKTQADIIRVAVDACLNHGGWND